MLSSGQRQLIAFYVPMLVIQVFLILDEATSSIDNSEEMIQRATETITKVEHLL
jgi:ABC-type multidrug transport system fused ATPase/permease subunit